MYSSHPVAALAALDIGVTGTLSAILVVASLANAYKMATGKVYRSGSTTYDILGLGALALSQLLPSYGYHGLGMICRWLGLSVFIDSCILRRVRVIEVDVGTLKVTVIV